MKLLLAIAILLIAPLFCIGQRFIERKDHIAKSEYSIDLITSNSTDSNTIIAFKYGKLVGSPLSAQTDTVRVIMLVCDTVKTKYIDVDYMNLQGMPEVYKNGIAYYKRPPVFWMYGYSVRELHNTGEDSIDPGFTICIDENGKEVSCYQDYWVHLLYLDEKKKPLSKNIVVWDSKLIK